MIVTPRIGLRIAAVIVAAVLLQVSFLSYLTPLGAAPDVVPVVVVALGLLGGGVIGATCGFFSGLLLDTALFVTLGAWSLALLAVGFLAGRFREGFEISNALVPPLVAGALTLVGGGLMMAIHVSLGVDSQVGLSVLRETFLQALFAIALAVPVFPLVRRILRPALIDDEPLAGRTGSGTGVLREGRRRAPRQRARVAGRARWPLGGGAE